MWKWIKALNPFAVQLRNDKALLEFARVALDEALAQLAQAEIELADKAFYVREFAAVSAERDALKAETKRLSEWSADATAKLAALRERASVPVPAGVPSVEECSALAEKSLRNAQLSGLGDGEQRYVVARDIRDAVLAGVAQQSSNAGQFPPADQVEALARVLRAAYMKECHVEPSDCLPNRGYLAEARAAIAHLATRPEGLPTADQLKAAHMKYVESYRKGENDGSMCATDFALEYLTPFLRQSVGWKLDVTAEELRDILLPVHRQSVTVMQATRTILDLCRSRIRPTFECKECAVIRAERDEINKNYMGLVDLLLPYLRAAQAEAAARAALEGE